MPIGKPEKIFKDVCQLKGLKNVKNVENVSQRD